MGGLAPQSVRNGSVAAESCVRRVDVKIFLVLWGNLGGIADLSEDNSFIIQWLEWPDGCHPLSQIKRACFRPFDLAVQSVWMNDPVFDPKSRSDFETRCDGRGGPDASGGRAASPTSNPTLAPTSV